ncbi:MAG: hypothetical protein JKX97_06740, partial [Candidatus Lindowbacteria bacterium]|nr:hypothetical protein [Candidatus Lindowbacteria bacterium]
HSMEPASAIGGGFIGFFRVAQMPIELHGLLLSAKPGDLLGPVPMERGSAIMRVEGIEESEMTDDIILEIKEEIFGDWVAERVEELEPSLRVPESSDAEEDALLDGDDFPDDKWELDDLRAFAKEQDITFEDGDSAEELLKKIDAEFEDAD